MAAFNLGDIFVKFKAKVEGFGDATDQIKKVGDGLKNTAEKVNKFGAGAEEVGKKMSVGLTAPLVAMGGIAVKTANDFNGAMANIATLIPGNTARIQEMKGAIQNLAIETGKSTADLAQGMYQVTSAFGDTADSVEILRINAMAAKGGLAETTDAINLTSAVTKGYGDASAEAVQKASDLALMTVRLGQTTFPELAKSIGLVTPLAASLNVTQEELFGTMATFTGVTGGASEVATQLRGVFQALMAPTAETTKLMKSLGFENGQAMIKSLGLQGSIDAMVKAAKDSGAPLQDYIGSIEGQTLALAATGGQADTYREKIAAMSDVAGTTSDAFFEVTEGVNKAGFAMEQAKARSEVARQKMGDALAPAVIKVSDAVSKLADWFTKLTPKGQKIVLVIAGIAAAIGPALIFIGKMAQGLSAVMKVFAVLSKVAFLTSPWFLAILALAAIAFLIYKNWDTLKRWMGTFWKWFKDVAASVFNWFKNNWKVLISLILGPIGVLIALIATYWNQIMGFFNLIWKGIQGVWNAIIITFQVAWAILVYWITALMMFWSTIFHPLWLAIQAIWNVILAVVQTALKFIWNIYWAWIGLITTALGYIWQAMQAVWNVITAIIVAAWQFIFGIVSAAVGFIGGIIGGLIGIVASVFSTVWNIVTGVMSKIVGFFGGVWDRIAGTFSGIGNGIKNTFSGIMDSVKDIVKGAINWVIDKVNWAIKKVNGTAGKVPGVPELPEIPKLASGGIVNRATLAVIGEAGPEAVVPLSKAGQFARDMGVGGQGQGGGNTFNVNGVFARSDAELADMFESAIELVDRRRQAQGKPAIMGS